MITRPKLSFPPIAGESPVILILGSLPGEESLFRQQYYAHPRNAFWPILGDILGFDPDLPYEKRTLALQQNRLALWDTLAQGIRKGSLDTNISSPVPNDIAVFVESNPTISTILCNGGAAHRYLKGFFPGLFQSPLVIRQLPSTSPAAARLKLEDKLYAYREAINAALA